MISLPIPLPNGFTPTISQGDTVTSGQTIAHLTAKDEQIINIAEQLSVPLDKVKHVLKKNPGDQVTVGDIIAVKKGFLGLDQHKIKSRVDGVITRYERDTGNLVINTGKATIAEYVVSPVDGVVSLCNNEKIVIETDKHVVLGKKGNGYKIEGEVFILEASLNPDTPDSLYHLDGRAIGKIVVGGNLSKEILIKGIGMGAIGFIGTNIKDEDLEHLERKNHKTPVLEIKSETIEKLTNWNGKKIILDSKLKSIIFLQ